MSARLEDLSCSVCQDIFKDPVILSCSHSFCKDCLKTWWKDKQTPECPLCKKRSSTSDLRCNLALKNLCEAFLLERDQRASAGSEDLCSLHFEKLKLFCLDHQQPVCLHCRDTKTHKNQRFRPIDEAAQDHKEELQNSLKPLQDKLKLFKKFKRKCDQTAEHIKVQARDTERKIKKQFKKLHQFLQEEEEVRIAVLREEKKQKSKVIKEKIETLSREIAALSDTIRTTEEELRAEDVSFLQNYKAAMREMVSYTPVILDPNTAHINLILSEDLTSMRCGEKQKLPENPERFDYYPIVLGSEGFNSGIHSWDVEVGHSRGWILGMINKKEIEGGMIVCCDNEYRAVSDPDEGVVLQVEKKLQRIRVHLDYEGGKLSFYDLDTEAHIHTFTETFTEKLFLYIGNADELPIKILPEVDDDDDNGDGDDDDD
ncbi:E3 ubiquitin-protein ligase TRIM39-like [Thunnus albacares]|uniref:E3 ubiquitin-protein ligase TRIM39-like n=1 Tax=Thunnus albacares TaxID=8236 RepID=UPI001CF6DA39|nr:E3 ubiquitin-protein ligase TRIM39-like [Thunnus albacares]